MKSLLNAIRTRSAMFTLLPVDHYTALGIALDATNAEIEIAYQIAVDQVTRTRLSLIVGVLCGRSPARLQVACLELLDPASRRNYDEHLRLLRAMFIYPPN